MINSGSFGQARLPGAAWAAALAGALCAAGCAAGSAPREDAPPGPFTPAPSYPNPNGPATQTPDPGAQNPGQTPSTPEPSDNTPTEPSGSAEPSRLGAATMGTSGQTTERYFKTGVTRNGQSYQFMANGWGPNFGSQSVSYNGTAFTVQNMTGAQGPNYEPASYPTVFCGDYSNTRSGECGLPAALDSLGSLRTGWSWEPNGNAGQYNAAYDVWLGTSADRASFSGYFMVWYRDPPGQQPAGSPTLRGVTVSDVPGTWDVWSGMVNGRPIINYVRREGQDTYELEFDMLDFLLDAQERGMTLPGTFIHSVAVGFEIWNGPVTNLESIDFYVDPQP